MESVVSIKELLLGMEDIISHTNSSASQTNMIWKIFLVAFLHCAIAAMLPYDQQSVEEFPKPYEFGYVIKDKDGEEYRMEEGDSMGTVKGSYKFTDDKEVKKQFDFVADKDGVSPYKLSYDIKDKLGEQFRQEEGDKNNTVKGKYGFTDYKGVKKEVDYVADKDGFSPYKFEYAIKDNDDEQYRKEEGDKNNTVKGSYGFTDGKGAKNEVSYVADKDGFSPYKLEYMIKDKDGEQYRQEEVDESKNVKGSYGFDDEKEVKRQVEYTADKDGFSPYKFEYTLKTDEGGQYRQEEGDKSNVMKGKYGFDDQKGVKKLVDYVADKDGFGPYKFEYAIKDKDGEQYRQEEVDDSNSMKGSYGFTDEKGVMRQVEYVADKSGFKAKVMTSDPGTFEQIPAAVMMMPEEPSEPEEMAPVVEQESDVVSMPVAYGYKKKMANIKYGYEAYSVGNEDAAIENGGNNNRWGSWVKKSEVNNNNNRNENEQAASGVGSVRNGNVESKYDRARAAIVRDSNVRYGKTRLRYNTKNDK